MRIIKFNIIISCLILFQISKINSQCYTMLTDLSGMTSNANSLLEEASCALADSFPGGAFRDSFGVYDFGFYLQTESMNGQAAIDAVFDEIESQISHPFYLLFGRKSDPNGIYTQLYVKFKFPVGIGKFDCLYEEDIANYKLFLPAFLNKQYSNLQNTPDNASLAIKETINEFKNFVMEKRECCVTGFTFSCSALLDDERLEDAFLNDGFYKIVGKEMDATSDNDTQNDYFKSYSKITIDGNEINDELKTLAQDISKYFTVRMEVYKNDLVGNFPSQEITSDKIFNILIIAQKQTNNKFKAFVKFYIPELQNSGKKIWLVKTEGANFDADAAKAQVISYFQALCGKLIEVEIADANNPSKKFDLNKYAPEDRIIVIGPNASKILRFLKETHSKCSDLFSNYFITDVNTQVYNEVLNTKNNKKMNPGPEEKISVEIGDGYFYKQNYFSVAGMMNESQFNYYKSEFRASSIPELIGFLSVHIVGHNALGAHASRFDPNFYMAEGEGIKFFMNDKDPSGNYYKSELKDLFNFKKYKDHKIYDYQKKLTEMNSKVCIEAGLY